MNKDNTNKDNTNKVNKLESIASKIKKLYKNLSYFDLYGGSLVNFIILSILLFLICSYCSAMINADEIKKDWINQRCKPNIMPFAGIINAPPNGSIRDYTSKNFTYCIQTILSNISAYAVEPISFITHFLQIIYQDLEEGVQAIRQMINYVREETRKISQEIFGRIGNVVISIQQMIISINDAFAKMQGTLTAGLFTAYGAYMTLKASIGAMMQLILIILITLAAIIATMWILPFTIPVAIAMTIIFILIAIPLVMIMIIVGTTLHISPVSIPTIQCFDKNTLIDTIDGKIKIQDIKVGTQLLNNDKVTATMKLDSINIQMYLINDIIVSGCHLIKYENKWIRVEKHPNAVKYAFYDEPYIYCLNTNSKEIIIDNDVFTDWDEIYDDQLEKIKIMFFLKHLIPDEYNKNDNSNITDIKNEDIHKYLDSGFTQNTLIEMKDKSIKEIKDIQVGDILKKNIYVKGIVEIDGDTITNQYIYNLGGLRSNDKNITLEGGPNINLCMQNINITSLTNLDKKHRKMRDKKDAKLYHLITNTSNFYIGDFRIYDYNSTIDLFLDKYRGKLLSMKYV